MGKEEFVQNVCDRQRREIEDNSPETKSKVFNSEMSPWENPGGP